MRPIKFRGRRLDNGQFVYGDLIHMTSGRIGIIFDKRVAAVEVEPDTVAQLVGYDCYEREVYEGDKLINERDGTIFTAGMNHIYTIKQYRLLED